MKQMMVRVMVLALLALPAACGGNSTGGQGTGGAGGSGTVVGGAGGSTVVADGTGGGGPGGGGGSTRVSDGGTLPPPSDLCQGLVQDKQAHPMTTLAKPALGQI